jgi:uncharacterized protein (TIGR02145 family)
LAARILKIQRSNIFFNPLNSIKMKRKNYYGLLTIAALLVILVVSCKKDELPTVTTSAVSEIKATSATCGGNITSEGKSSVTDCGVCWSTGQTPTINDNMSSEGPATGSFTSSLYGLTPNTTYYVRAFATNDEGTAYGNVTSFKTIAGATVYTDIDGNQYHAVTVGTQMWLSSNLKVTHYRNGDAIANVTLGSDWDVLTTGAYCDYNNTASNSNTYGRLYNWYAVNDSRNIAPAGFHVATDAEWTTLVSYLGGDTIAGGKLKETGTSHWNSPNTGATNSTGFTALPGGNRFINDQFWDLGNMAALWTSTEKDASNAMYWKLAYNGKYVSTQFEKKKWGFSVRCVKD